MNRLEEVQVKLQRVRHLIEQRQLSGLLLKTQPNFSWLTAGGLNSVGIATELGVTSILVTPDGLYLIANTIEAPRAMKEEGLGELGFTLLTFDWYENRELQLVREIVGDGSVGCDVAVSGLLHIADDVAKLRYELTEGEVDRYLFLGTKVSTAIENTLMEVKPGDSEAEVIGRLCAELWKDRIDAVGYQSAADERAYLYRHPIPTMRRVDKYLMLCINARYKGLVTSITRLVHFGQPASELLRQFRHNLEIECAMIAKTRVGRPMREPLLTAIEMYEQLGYAGEWKLHHQGGAMGYYARDIRVTPTTQDLVGKNQAFCWNPSISGTKTEDAFIATPDGPKMITGPVVYPAVTVESNGFEFKRPGMLVL
ncbi:MAG TPA: M24 family metallopeptidase [Firmicutes bacterium]|nr:M24 family metallopeptidase [Bacillota bacterium]